MENGLQSLIQRKKWSVVTMLIGLGLVSFALALSGPIVGAGASPIAVPLILAGSFVAVVGFALIVWKKH